MDVRAGSPTRSSNYGLACMQCVKAKCRCVPRSSGGSSCERCFRLRKDCQPSNSARRRNAQKEKDSDARIAHLEGKIDTLLSVVQSAAGASGSSIDLHRLLNGGSMPLSMTGSSGVSTNSTSAIPDISQGPTPPTESFPTAPPSPALSDITPFEAEASFNFFRARMLPCFPFISLAPDVTVWQVRQHRPFLFQAIITVTTLSTQKKFARAEELKRLIFTSALLDVQSSFDLLVGILTYVAWSTDAFLGRADLLSRLMMLAISLVYDLRLFKPPPPDVQLLVTLTQGFSDDSRLANEETLHSFMDQQRAVLACFVLSSNISSHFGRIDALRWTPQMEEALRVIEKNKPYPTDEGFVFEVRLHLLMQRAAHIREQHDADRARTSTTTAGPVPGFLYLKALRGQLQEFRDALSPELQQQGK
ncbi:hypothetical protein PISL3812_07400 [Talaromyces islandicus]|uniref:Zn(2)-C6 fungal-type domain-containing protein n=1 Tax=Talaromyces islandicus TaxID=28573 RepID=A0A0U1M5Y8_TALIS|nr:hypothetical protein PISL3812_07400 [Talaromyces islandicus]